MKISWLLFVLNEIISLMHTAQCLAHRKDLINTSHFIIIVFGRKWRFYFETLHLYFWFEESYFTSSL